MKTQDLQHTPGLLHYPSPFLPFKSRTTPTKFQSPLSYRLYIPISGETRNDLGITFWSPSYNGMSVEIMGAISELLP